MNVTGTTVWTVVTTVGLCQLAWAGNCPCQQSMSSPPSMSGGTPYVSPAPMMVDNQAAMGHSAFPPPGYASGTMVMPAPSIGGTNPAANWNQTGVMQPPPGTLGRTYLRRTTLIPDTEHPRQGVVWVNLPEQADVSARGLKVEWTGEMWRLESEQALVPGVPHIYAIKAEWDTPNGRTTQVRWVRLIMGREVELEF